MGAQESCFVRVEQADWDKPILADWVRTLERYVSTHQNVVLVAHSLACIAVAHWAKPGERRVKAALIVALPDVERKDMPEEVRGFAPIPMRLLPFPSVLVASRNDPYTAFGRAEAFARAWGSGLVNEGQAGHINSDSGHGEWPAKHCCRKF